MERPRHTGPGDLERRDQSEDQRREQGHTECERHDRTVQTDVAGPRNRVGIDGEQRGHTDLGQPDPDQTGHHGQQHVLDEQLPEDAHASRAHRRPHRHLTASGLGP